MTTFLMFRLFLSQYLFMIFMNVIFFTHSFIWRVYWSAFSESNTVIAQARHGSRYVFSTNLA